MRIADDNVYVTNARGQGVGPNAGRYGDDSFLGTLRRGPDARWRIQLESLVAHLPVQRELLEIAARCARRRVVYATCTINRLENEDAAARFEAAHPEFRRARDLFQLLPHKDGTDGFFAAVWDRR